MKTENIHNLVFDFGGVIYQIDFNRQKKAFSDIGIQGFEKLYSQANQNSLFCDLETGKLSEHDFREKLADLIGKSMSQEKIDELWNSILIDYFHDNVSLLQKLQSRYRLFILSNTNSIHYQFYAGQFMNKYGFDLNELFEKSYWSFKIGMRKPNNDIFEKIITENGLTRQNALFIDDTIQNIKSAEQFGLTSYHLKKAHDLMDLFDENLNLKAL